MSKKPFRGATDSLSTKHLDERMGKTSNYAETTAHIEKRIVTVTMPIQNGIAKSSAEQTKKSK